MTLATIAVAGSSGRMGRALLEAVLQSADMRLGAALEQGGDAHLGKDAGELVGAPCGIAISADVEKSVRGCDALIDFTRPEGTLAHLAACRKARVRMVIGTTGFSAEQQQTMAERGPDIAIVMAPNMGVGTDLVFKLSELGARVLNEGYGIEISGADHRHKVDAPSGTALHIGGIIAQALGRNLAECSVYSREGVTGERKSSTIGFATIRGGDIVGEHTVLFAGTGERVEITVRAGSRATYAQGALRAVRFVKAKQAGFVDMQDVLGLR